MEKINFDQIWKDACSEVFYREPSEEERRDCEEMFALLNKDKLENHEKERLYFLLGIE